MSPGTEVQQDGAAGSQSGLCWALRGAEVAAGGCFPVFPCFFPCFSPFSLITVTAYGCCRALSSSCVWDCWWEEEEGASLSSGAIKEPKSRLFLHLTSRCEPQLQPAFSCTRQSPAGCQCPVQGRAGARHTLHSPGQLTLCQPQQHGQIRLPGTTPGHLCCHITQPCCPDLCQLHSASFTGQKMRLFPLPWTPNPTLFLPPAPLQKHPRIQVQGDI